VVKVAWVVVVKEAWVVVVKEACIVVVKELQRQQDGQTVLGISITMQRQRPAVLQAKLLAKPEVQKLSFRRSVVDWCKAGLYSCSIGHKNSRLVYC
jgi:hypothetical protein